MCYTHLPLLVVHEAHLEEGVECRQVLVELPPTCIREGPDCQHGLLMHSGAAAAEHLQEGVHDFVCILQHGSLVALRL